MTPYRLQLRAPAIRRPALLRACSRVARRMPISRWVGLRSVERLDAASPSGQQDAMLC